MKDEQQLVERLRAIDEDAMYQRPITTYEAVNEAADLIEQQAAALSILKPEIEAMREALEYAVSTAARDDMSDGFKVICIAQHAHAALNGGPTNEQ